jgi:aspartate/methionine/tyrosine aminotransferase
LNESVTYSAPSPSQSAGIFALNHAETLTSPVVATFKARLDYIAKRVDDIPFLSMGPVRGSIYAFINISETGLDSVAFSEKLLEDTRVLVIPGKAFGENIGDDYFRLAATQGIDVLKEAFDRIETFSV